MVSPEALGRLTTVQQAELVRRGLVDGVPPFPTSPFTPPPPNEHDSEPEPIIVDHQYACYIPNCGRVFRHQTALIHHVETKHGEAYRTSSPSPTQPRRPSSIEEVMHRPKEGERPSPLSTPTGAEAIPPPYIDYRAVPLGLSNSAVLVGPVGRIVRFQSRVQSFVVRMEEEEDEEYASEEVPVVMSNQGGDLGEMAQELVEGEVVCVVGQLKMSDEASRSPPYVRVSAATGSIVVLK